MHDSSGLVFIGCVILGVGVGLLFDQVAAGSVIGVGLGFLAMAFVRRKRD